MKGLKYYYKLVSGFRNRNCKLISGRASNELTELVDKKNC